MQMMTSYYAMRKHFSDKSKIVSISLDGGRVAKFNGRTYPNLAPPPDMLVYFHKHKNTAFYTEIYKQRVLSKLNPYSVASELGDGAVLLCYERPSDFCHRHIVAEWLKKYALIDIKEFVPPPKVLPLLENVNN
jgi:hypothetical protein